MSQLFTVHTAIVGGTSYYFLCKPQTYQGISNKVGVEEADSDVSEVRIIKVTELLRHNLLLRVTLYYLVGSRRRIAKVLCRSDKIKDFMFSARGTNYRGGVIGTATTTSKIWRK